MRLWGVLFSLDLMIIKFNNLNDLKKLNLSNFDISKDFISKLIEEINNDEGVDWMMHS
jgi:hypothetical protein